MRGKITDEITINDVSDAVIKIRQSKLPDPKVHGNAGSFFKNPEIDLDLFEKLKNEFPNIVSYKVGENKVKIPAGWLIENAGLKGKRTGNVGTHPKQSLVIINYGGATSSEIFEFKDMIKAEVNKKFGIKLEEEVNII